MKTKHLLTCILCIMICQFTTIQSAMRSQAMKAATEKFPTKLIQKIKPALPLSLITISSTLIAYLIVKNTAPQSQSEKSCGCHMRHMQAYGKQSGKWRHH